MKWIFTFGFALLFVSVQAQKPVNTLMGVAVKGYDVVSYFDQKAKRGSQNFEHKHEGTTYYFSSAANKEKFIANPQKFLPQYGGFCAYAMGKTGDQVDINPNTFEIRDGKLYLFYNSLFNNTLKSWIKEKPSSLIPVANKNWAKL